MRRSGDKSSSEGHRDCEEKLTTSNKTTHDRVGQAKVQQTAEEIAENEELVKRLVAENSSVNPNRKEMRRLHRRTFQYRRNWILSDPAPSISDVNNTFAYLKLSNYVSQSVRSKIWNFVSTCLI